MIGVGIFVAKWASSLAWLQRFSFTLRATPIRSQQSHSTVTVSNKLVNT